MQSALSRYVALVLMGLFASLPVAAEPQNNPDDAAQRGEGRVALVIGNAAYPGAGALKNPANDARDFAGKLRRLGFDVMVRTDVRQKEMLRALTEFGDRVRPGSEVLFFYAGHGMQVRGKNYLIPIDAEIRNESSVSSEAVDVDQLLDKLAPARLSLVILDACRNNPFERSFRGGGQGLAQINAPTGTLIAYATAPGKVAADGEGRNGLYTAELLAAMEVPGIRIEDVFKRVRANVVRKSADGQTPWESSSLTGDFYFTQGAVNITVNPPASVRPARIRSDAELEQELWDSIKDANSAEALGEYIKGYPKGRFVAQARVLMAKVKREVAAANLPAPALPAPGTTRLAYSAEDAVWASVEKGNRADDYDAYLTQYPQGKFAVLAKNRKARLEQELQSANQQDNNAWALAEKDHSKDSYDQYLRLYPQGAHVTLARERMDRLMQEEKLRNAVSVGKRVLGQWGDGLWYPASIVGQVGNLFNVAFDDGDKADLPEARIRPISWTVGTRVQCNWKSRGRYYSGTITTSNGLAIHVSYDDGDQEDTSISKCRSR